MRAVCFVTMKFRETASTLMKLHLGMFMNKTLERLDKPEKYVAYGRAFRCEAGPSRD
jgi:seryl-tRNA synthetase